MGNSGTRIGKFPEASLRLIRDDLRQVRDLLRGRMLVKCYSKLIPLGSRLECHFDLRHAGALCTTSDLRSVRTADSIGHGQPVQVRSR